MTKLQRRVRPDPFLPGRSLTLPDPILRLGILADFESRRNCIDGNVCARNARRSVSPKAHPTP
jgi:hypothetical protein